MTYCVAIAVKDGLVFVSDSRTNAGVDQVSTYSKLHTFGRDGERQFVILSAGNLATTQAVIAQVKHDIKEHAPENLMTVRTMTEAADYVGQVSRSQQTKHTGGGVTYEATFILGGQIGTAKPEAMLIYPEGNHITTSKYTCYLQVGESKYGKPILDRILKPDTTLDTAALCALVSMDSTMRSNVTVGPPIELLIYERDALRIQRHIRLEEDNPYLRELKRNWDERLRQAFRQLPPIQWATAKDLSQLDVHNATY